MSHWSPQLKAVMDVTKDCRTCNVTIIDVLISEVNEQREHVLYVY